MSIRSEETYIAILKAMSETRYVSKVAERVGIDRVTVYRLLAASEQNPKQFQVEFDCGSGPETRALHEHAKYLRRLGKIASAYFDEEPTSEDDAARIQGARGLIARGPNFKPPSTVKSDYHVPMYAPEMDGDNTAPLDDDSDLEFGDDLPEIVVDPDAADKLPGVPDAKNEYRRGRRWIPAAERIPAAEAPVLTQPATAMTSRQRAAAEHRAKIERRGTPATPGELELLQALENPPDFGKHGQNVPISTLPPAIASRTSTGDPEEHIGSGQVAAGGVKTR